MSEHQRTDGHSTEDVQEGRVPAALRGEVVCRKRDRCRATMAMDCEVREAFIPRTDDGSAHEVGRQLAVATCARHILIALCGGQELSTNQEAAPADHRDASEQHAAVLVAVAGKEVGSNLVGDALWEDQ